jgi:hypothetical protein
MIAAVKLHPKVTQASSLRKAPKGAKQPLVPTRPVPKKLSPFSRGSTPQGGGGITAYMPATSRISVGPRPLRPRSSRAGGLQARARDLLIQQKILFRPAGPPAPDATPKVTQASSLRKAPTGRYVQPSPRHLGKFKSHSRVLSSVQVRAVRACPCMSVSVSPLHLQYPDLTPKILSYATGLLIILLILLDYVEI